MRIVSKPQSDRRARVDELACLPVFFTLTGKRVIVVGGSDAAAWKAELLLAAGAKLDVFCMAGELGRDMVELLSQFDDAGRMRHFDGDWRAADFAGAALAIADLDVEDAPQFVAMARAVSVPVNVIDKPAFCDFQFGSIVNRSPVVIGISTAGAAPILGQAVRRRVEAVLPMALGEWGRLAGAMRAGVMARLKAGAERRRFWEAFAERAFGASGQVSAGDLLERVEAGADMARGRIIMVGGGPGGAELVTLQAVRALQSADEIFYESAVDASVLELARREARRECANLRFGTLSSAQRRQIEALARAGKTVVVLSAGDAIEAWFADGLDVQKVRGIGPDLRQDAMSASRINRLRAARKLEIAAR